MTNSTPTRSYPEPDRNAVRVSLCITCMGRLPHLQKTLPENLAANRAFSDVEFILLDYSSPDGLGEWVRSTFMPEINSATLVYCRAEGYERFFMAHAKNIAHRLARGEILCNLDADNFTGPDFASYLWELLRENKQAFAHPQGNLSARGRVAFRKRDSEALGGYDEDMSHGWGYEDNDLIARARRSGLTAVTIDPKYSQTLSHDDTERVRHYADKDKMNSRRRHERISRGNLAAGRLVANLGRRWGSATVVRNFTETIAL